MNRPLAVPILIAGVALLGACAVVPVGPPSHGAAYRIPDPYYVDPDPYYVNPDPYYRGYDPGYVYPGYPGVGIGITVPPAVIVPRPPVIVRPAPVIVVPGRPRHRDRHDDAHPPYRHAPRAGEPGASRPPIGPGQRREPPEAFVPRDERGEAPAARPARPRFFTPGNAGRPVDAARDAGQGVHGRATQPGRGARAPSTDSQARTAPAQPHRADPPAAARERRSRSNDGDGGSGNAGRAEVDRP